MSIRSLGTRLFKHGQTYVRLLCKRDFNSNIVEKLNALPEVSASPGQISHTRVASRSFALRNVGLQVGIHARKILIDNVLNRVTNSLAAELRKKAAKRILFGDSAPFFALVGVSLASGTGILTKEEELEGVCWEIREAISKVKWHFHDVDIEEKACENESVTLQNLDLDTPIAKGANAVVYAAKMKLQNEENLYERDETLMVSNQTDLELVSEQERVRQLHQLEESVDGSFNKYPLAVKMMFNYDIQSNSLAIFRAMYRETVPARAYYANVGTSDWAVGLSSNKRYLSPHPNIVAMFSVFADYIPELKEAKGLYPAALPRRLYAEGEGRNMSLFLLMKRYNCNLQQYLLSNEISMRTSILLLAQLLEGIAHIAAHEIAHRDLKSDNLLLDTSEDETPILVISDFGCCLADKTHGLLLPYSTAEIDKGGNTALMAPEIINQTPGAFSVLNYSKSDLWAAGTIAYEIFGACNPFYANDSKKLKNSVYKEEDLPDLPGEVPAVVKALVRNLLQRNPSRRLNPEIASNVCQLFLWAPSGWLKANVKLPTSTEILQWLLSLTTKVLCEGRLNNVSLKRSASSSELDNSNNVYKTGRRTYPEYLLISSFLCRAKLCNIKAALTWIHNNI